VDGKDQQMRQLQEPALSPLEALRIASLDEASRLSGLSERTLRRRFSEYIIQISPRRQGMRVAHALMLQAAPDVSPAP
jgi:hypothetical protein